jgi:hypothetical protein
VKTRSKVPSISKDPTTTQTSGERSTLNHPKAPFSPCKNLISIHTRESPKLEYNVVEYLKKLKANISVMDICRIPQQKYFLLQSFKSIENPMTSNEQQRNLTSTDLVNKPTVNTCLEDKKGKPFVPRFLLTFELFNMNLHNCLVDSGASSTLIPLSVCKKLNVVPLKSDKHVIQLDRTQVKVMGELRDIMIMIATHPKFFQVIDVIVVDMPEAYELLLSRDWYENLNGYFSTGWEHLWLPLKGYKNMIRNDRESYLKHTVSYLETPNEPSSRYFPVLGSYSCDSYFDNFSPLPSDVPLTQNSEMVLLSLQETL